MLDFYMHHSIIIFQISGCSPFNIDSKDVDLNARSYYYSTFFVIDAQVNENATGITLNATQTSTGFSSTAISLSFDGTLDVFKPGLPFKAVVSITPFKISFKITSEIKNVDFSS